jgi:hypothetical protein
MHTRANFLEESLSMVVLSVNYFMFSLKKQGINATIERSRHLKKDRGGMMAACHQ